MGERNGESCLSSGTVPLSPTAGRDPGDYLFSLPICLGPCFKLVLHAQVTQTVCPNPKDGS